MFRGKRKDKKVPGNRSSRMLRHDPKTASAACRHPTNSGSSNAVMESALVHSPTFPAFEPRVALVQVQRTVKPGLNAIAHGHHAHRVPLAKSRSLHSRRRDLAAPPIVVQKRKLASRAELFGDFELRIFDADSHNSGGLPAVPPSVSRPERGVIIIKPRTAKEASFRRRKSCVEASHLRVRGPDRRQRSWRFEQGLLRYLARA